MEDEQFENLIPFEWKTPMIISNGEIYGISLNLIGIPSQTMRQKKQRRSISLG